MRTSWGCQASQGYAGAYHEWAITPQGHVSAGSGTGVSSKGAAVVRGQWHRLAMVARLREGTVSWAVDGAVVAELKGNEVAVDDRWALDSVLTLFPDCRCTRTPGKCGAGGSGRAPPLSAWLCWVAHARQRADVRWPRMCGQ